MQEVPKGGTNTNNINNNLKAQNSYCFGYREKALYRILILQGSSLLT